MLISHDKDDMIEFGAFTRNTPKVSIEDLYQEWIDRKLGVSERRSSTPLRVKSLEDYSKRETIIQVILQTSLKYFKIREENFQVQNGDTKYAKQILSYILCDYGYTYKEITRVLHYTNTGSPYYARKKLISLLQSMEKKKFEKKLGVETDIKMLKKELKEKLKAYI